MALDSELVYGKMERALERQQALPPGQRCPELPVLLISLRLGQIATRELELAEEQLKSGTWPRTASATKSPRAVQGGTFQPAWVWSVGRLGVALLCPGSSAGSTATEVGKPRIGL